jgi:SAM-dependent methyltransferase
MLDMTDLPPGWLVKDEAELLYKYAMLCDGDILEVGCYKGRSTVVLAQTGRRVLSVDKFADFAKYDLSGEDIKKRFLDNTRHLPNVELFVGPVENWTPCPVGFAYLDGDHTYEGTKRQIQVAKLCHPTYIALHDVNDGGGGLQVKKACLELLGSWKERVGRLAVFTGE